MMSLQTINQLNYEAGVEAAELGREPFVLWDGDLEKIPPFPFPYLGDFTPEGWNLLETHFVDSSGWGEEGEAALTLGEFLEILKEKIPLEHGYAVVSAGQFQVYIGEFERE